ncbi:MAG: anaerobic ribonucleoside-triphosphate reductase activating protein [Clostridiales bacterium]|nr:anaerobic ribonucleoside-triphosphate reductase activating protein [Clostridiales bacterium]
MEINGLQKLTLLDYPGYVACTVFLAGCNLRCPFCHNARLVVESPEEHISDEEFFSFLRSRRGRLDGVCITGGEPLLRPDLAEFLARIRDCGMLIKLDTNGTLPEKLGSIVSSGAVDYIAMDIKNSLPLYSRTCGTEVCTDDILSSISIIAGSGIDHEFRTTCARGLHTPDSIRELTSLIKGENKYFLQSLVDSGDMIDKTTLGLSPEEMRELLSAARENVPSARLRGI